MPQTRALQALDHLVANSVPPLTYPSPGESSMQGRRCAPSAGLALHPAVGSGGDVKKGALEIFAPGSR